VQRTNTKKFLDTSLAPLDKIAAFAATHVKNSPRRLSSSSTGPVKSRGEGGVSKPLNKDGLDPIIEILQTNDGRIKTLRDPNIRTGVV
jgi:hypothetical protein